jgi:hypothetical protein
VLPVKAHIRAISHPSAVQPKKKFTSKMASELRCLLLFAAIDGIKYKTPIIVKINIAKTVRN